MSSAIAAFRVVDKGGAPALERAWTSRKMASPRTPIVVNGVVFALAGGNSGTNAVLYALDPATGKELWNSGTRSRRRPAPACLPARVRCTS